MKGETPGKRNGCMPGSSRLLAKAVLIDRDFFSDDDGGARSSRCLLRRPAEIARLTLPACDGG